MGGRAFQDIVPQAVLDQLTTDYIGVFNVLQATEAALRRTGVKPNVGLVSSMSSQFPGLNGVGVSYGPAKCAVDALVWEMARNWGPWGCRVNSVAIGFSIGAQNRKILLGSDGQPTERGKRFLGQTPQNDFVRADQVAAAYVFLTSPVLSGFINGHVLPVDGGYLVGRW